MRVIFIHRARSSPWLFNALFVFLVYFVLFLFACCSYDHLFSPVFSEQKSERWLQLQDLRLSRLEAVGAKEKAIWVPCPNSIPVEISPATPRSNTGQQGTEDKLIWRALNFFFVFCTCCLHATGSGFSFSWSVLFCFVLFFYLGNQLRIPLRSCAPVTSAGSWRRGSGQLHVKRPGKEDQEVYSNSI